MLLQYVLRDIEHILMRYDFNRAHINFLLHDQNNMWMNWMNGRNTSKYT